MPDETPQPAPEPAAPRRESPVRRVEDDATAPPSGVTLVMHQARRPSWWPVALAACVLGVTAALLALILVPMWMAKDTAEQVAAEARAGVVAAAEIVADAVRPTVVRRDVVQIVSEQAASRSKLVVYDHPVRVTIRKAEEYRLLWDYLYLGQNTATVRIDGNRVQWFVDLAGFDEEDVRVDEAAKTVTLRFPPPTLDREMVVVQTDPEQIRVETERGWARLPTSPDTLVDAAKREIRPRIVHGADTTEHRAAAARAADEALTELFKPLAARVAPEGYRVEVEVADEKQ